MLEVPSVCGKTDRQPAKASAAKVGNSDVDSEPRTQHFLKVAFAIIVDPDELEGAAEIRRVAVGHKVSQSLSASC